MKRINFFKLMALSALTIASALWLQTVQAQQQKPSAPQPVAQQATLPQHPVPTTDGKDQVVQLCDGETYTTVKGVKPGERLTPQQAQAASDELMTMWYAKIDPAKAAAWKREAANYSAAPAPVTSTAAPQQKRTTPTSGGGKGKTPTPANVPNKKEEAQFNEITARDTSIWDRELKNVVTWGDQIFHDDKLIASTNGVACAMCHPNAANTHPETYPKFQVQLKRVAMLRDMINWCIENPSRGKKLAADDPKMQALEAYIMAQRKGVKMEYGKH